jgi:hypothetical protein
MDGRKEEASTFSISCTPAFQILLTALNYGVLPLVMLSQHFKPECSPHGGWVPPYLVGLLRLFLVDNSKTGFHTRSTFHQAAPLWTLQQLSEFIYFFLSYWSEFQVIAAGIEKEFGHVFLSNCFISLHLDQIHLLFN